MSYIFYSIYTYYPNYVVLIGHHFGSFLFDCRLNLKDNAPVTYDIQALTLVSCHFSITQNRHKYDISKMMFVAFQLYVSKNNKRVLY